MYLNHFVEHAGNVTVYEDVWFCAQRETFKSDVQRNIGNIVHAALSRLTGQNHGAEIHETQYHGARWRKNSSFNATPFSLATKVYPILSSSTSAQSQRHHHAKCRVETFPSQCGRPSPTCRSAASDGAAGSCVSCGQNGCVPEGRCRYRRQAKGERRESTQLLRGQSGERVVVRAQ